MKVIPFPGGGAERPDEAWLTELEAALTGTGEGPHTDSWRELRADVRALAPPMTPEFERDLGERIAERRARSVSKQPSRPKQPQRRLGWLRRPGRPALAGVSVVCTVIAVVLIVAPWRPASHLVESPPRSLSIAARADNAGRASGTVASTPAAAGKAGRALAPDDLGPASAAAGATPGRVQQLGASISFTAIPGEVQTVADRVARLAVSEGGFVQSSPRQRGGKNGRS